MSEHEVLPKELAELFAAEKAAPVADAAVRAAAKSRLVAAVGHVPLGQAAAAVSTIAGAGKVIAVIALTVGIGASTVALVKHGSRKNGPLRARAEIAAAPPQPEAQPQPQPLEPDTREANTPEPRALGDSARPPEQPAVEASPLSDGPELASMPSVAAVRAPSRLAKRQPRSQHELRPSHEAQPSHGVLPAQQEVRSEVQLLRSAWAALNANQGAEALELVRDDERLHRDGLLAEERQALTVLALAKLGRLDDARAASSVFIANYPTSVHRSRVERALALEVEGTP